MELLQQDQINTTIQQHMNNQNNTNQVQQKDNFQQQQN
jgi:hypothetical protein